MSDDKKVTPPPGWSKASRSRRTYGNDRYRKKQTCEHCYMDFYDLEESSVGMVCAGCNLDD